MNENYTKTDSFIHHIANVILRYIYIIICINLMALFLYSTVFGDELDEESGNEYEIKTKEHMLYSVTVPGAPIIVKNKKIMYGLDLIFDTVPGDYWVYYSENTKKLVVDFYGIYITGDTKVDLSGRGVFRDVTIDNYNTNLALTNKRSTILIDVVPDPGWHFKAISVNNRVIRITAWKDITGLTKIERKKKAVGRYVIITALVSLITFVSVYAINKY